MQYLVDRLRQVQGSNLAMTCGRIAAEAMLDAYPRRPRSRPPARRLHGIAFPEPGAGRASVPEVGVAEKREIVLRGRRIRKI